MQDSKQALPEEFEKLHEIEVNYLDGDGIDFEPYSAFLSEKETAEWFAAWTGNPNTESRDYLIFGQDGTGGLAAIWKARPGVGLLAQPIVFFGSEGELGVIASNFSDYLWLLASGHGPYEATAYLEDDRSQSPLFAEYAAKYAATPRRSAGEIVRSARAEFPNFESDIRKLCG